MQAPGGKQAAYRHRSTSVDRQTLTRSNARRIRVGICALDKKAKSKPMESILKRFDLRVFDVVIFGDDLILNRPIEEWPQVDCLMSWYSTGFPLRKAEAYVSLRAPFCINDLSTEHILRSRIRFYEVLKAHNIPVPMHVIVDRSGPKAPCVIEGEDFIEVDGVRLSKPFVEKPFDAEDHNVHIYYPRRLGGGSKRLFRKRSGNRVFVYRFDYLPENLIRRDGSYLYEAFLMTQGTDIKIYVVGPDYAHAEARKSPVVDGIVQRDKEGKEVRFPIMLTNKEKDVARRVCLAFKQNVCGFDLLRTPGRSYVCDVNGWSNVKKSKKYYDDASEVLQLLMLRAVMPERLNSAILAHTSPPAGLVERARAPLRRGGSGLASPVSEAEHERESVTGRGSRSSLYGYGDASPDEELRCVVAIVRHGDRTPKQKMKLLVSDPAFIALHKQYARNPREEAKLKSAQQLQAVLEVTRALVAARSGDRVGASSASETVHSSEEAGARSDDFEPLLHMKRVLEKGGHFDGINRKVQLKPTRWAPIKTRRPAARATPASSSGSALDLRSTGGGLSPTRPVILWPSSTGESESVFDFISSPGDATPGAGVQVPLDETEWEEIDDVCVTECLLVLKWGGVLTHAGMKQAEVAGQRFRQTMYPGESVGLLRLHATYRHDLKIYSSDEGRVQMTAAAFVKGFLDLEGELTPILASLVRTVYSSNLLDDADPASDVMTRIKKKLMKALTTAIDPRQSSKAAAGLAETQSSSVQPLQSEAGAVLGISTKICYVSPPTLTDRVGCDPVSSVNPEHEAVRVDHVPTSPQMFASPHLTSDIDPLTLLGLDDANVELLRRVHLPDAQEIAALEQKAGAIVDAIAPTRAPALLKALCVIGNDPSATLRRILELISSLVAELTSLIPQQNQDILRPWLLRSGSASSSSVDNSLQSPADESINSRARSASIAPLRIAQPRHSELDRMLRSQAGSRPTVSDAPASGHVPHVSSLESLSPSTPAIERAHEGAFDEWCCGGESLWLMRERWQKLQTDFFSAKKDRFDLSKIPDIYDQVKHDCVHNSALELADLPELYRLSKAFADVVVNLEYGISADEKKDIAGRICHHLLRKIYFDCTAVAVEDSVEAELPPAPPVVATVTPRDASSLNIMSSTLSSLDQCKDSSSSSLHRIPNATDKLPSLRWPAISKQWHTHAAMERAAVVSASSPIYGLIVTKHRSPLVSSLLRARRKSHPSYTRSYTAVSSVAAQHSFLQARVVQSRDRAIDRVVPSSITSRAARRSGVLPGRRPSGKGGRDDTAAQDMAALARASPGARLRETDALEDSFDDSLSTMAPLYDRAPHRGLVLVPGVRRRMNKDTSPGLPADYASDGESLTSGQRNSGGSKSIAQLVEKSSALTATAGAPAVAADLHPVSSGASDASGGAASVALGGGGGAKVASIMEAIAEDMHDLQETVHQLDGEALVGYGEVKSPLRHVRTRLYFTSESHVHAIVNTLKYWAVAAEGTSSHSREGDAGSSSKGSFSLPCASSSVGSDGLASSIPTAQTPQIRLVSPEGMRMLEATPELDYLTHIVLRLYENFRYPIGHPQRHRLEILFSPGASFSPVTGAPRTPRLAAVAPLADPSPVMGEPQMRQSFTDPPAGTRADGIASSFEGAPFEGAEPDTFLQSSGQNGSERPATPFAAPSAAKPSNAASAVFSGPTLASPGDLSSHTLPVHSVLPLTVSLTLQEFEDVVSEAIYSGSKGGKQKEQHPKEEAKARAAAAAMARARGEGY